MTDPRLTIIRLAIALLASLALLWLSPAWAWVPVALFMPPALLSTGHADCGLCAGDAADQMQIDISGVTNPNAQCGDCDTNYNDSFVVDWLMNTGSPAFVCFWTLGSLSFCAGTGQTATDLIMTISLTQITISFNTSGGTQLLVWLDNTSPPDDCTTYSNENIPQNGGASTGCSNTASTLLLTAL